MAAKEFTVRSQPAQSPEPNPTRIHKGDAILSLSEMVEQFMPTARPLMSLADLRIIEPKARFPQPTDELIICDYCDDWCDCTARATVHLIETEEDLCLRHFEKRLKENL